MMLLAPAVTAQQGPGPSAGNPAHATRVGGSQPAASAEGGKGRVGFRLGYYDNDDRAAGNPFLDESLTVIEPVVFFDMNVNAKTNVWGTVHYDNISSASIARLSRFANHSGASGDEYYGLDLGATWRLGNRARVGSFVHGSYEHDYRSLGFGASYAHDTADHNTTVKASLSGYFDEIDVIRFDAVDEPSERRTAANASVQWYQVIDTRTHAEMGLNVTVQNGLLSTPYNGVVLENASDPPNPTLANFARGTEFAEVLPNHRFRVTLSGRARSLLGSNIAAELGGRLYADDWGVRSVTAEPALYLWLARDQCMARLRYRFYAQSAAEQYSARVVGAALPRFRTQDADLGDFTSHTAGCQFDWFLSPALRCDLTFDYQFRSDGLDNLFGSIGWTYSF